MRIDKTFKFQDMNKKVDMHRVPDTVMFTFWLKAEEKVKTRPEDLETGAWKNDATYVGEIYVPFKQCFFESEVNGEWLPLDQPYKMTMKDRDSKVPQNLQGLSNQQIHAKCQYIPLGHANSNFEADGVTLKKDDTISKVVNLKSKE